MAALNRPAPATVDGADAADTALAQVAELELELLLEAVFQRFGYDFRAHDRARLHARLRPLLRERALASLSQLQHAVLHDAGAAQHFLGALTVQPMPMFSDPEHARLVRIALACLHACAVPRVWLADCPGAECAWSLAILLAEERLHARTEIFATVPTEAMLRTAHRASIPVASLPEYQENYLKSGGRGNLADYFDVKGKHATLIEPLRARITWAQYSLVTDASPNEFQMVMCHRSLPEFGPVLRQRVLQVLHDSLALFGVLGIDRPFAHSDRLGGHYQPLFPGRGWYKRTS
jgi:chemotaxis protein methyltransferase CheR